MKTASFVIFFSVFFTLYGLINFYVGLRGFHCLPPNSVLRTWFWPVFIFIALSFMAGRMLAHVYFCPVSHCLIVIGSFWFGAMVYFLLLAVFSDLLRLADRFIPLFPSIFTRDPVKARLAVFWISAASVFVLMIAGTLNAAKVRVTTVDLTLPKKRGSRSTLNIALASDIHLGTMVGKRMMGKIASTIQGLKPDLILFAGDVIDEDPEPVIRKNLGEALKSLHAPLGVFAVPGNHEYFGGIEKTQKYLTDHGITLLRDRVAVLDSCVNLAGREDPTMQRVLGRKRLLPGELLAAADPAFPVIMMDHQPPRRNREISPGADLLLCGHSHDGQFWPVNWITDRLYNPGYGYRRADGTQICVSSGAGTWGPPIRIGTRPEVVNLRIKFE